MSYGIWPSFWKCAVITPIFKSGSAIDVENYGPNAFLLNSLLLERSIFNYIYPYVKVKISNSQHGFLKNRSTVTQLVEFVDLIYTCNDQNIATWTVYFDFRKAFDSVPHNLLLNKLSIMVLDQKFIDLLSSYLRGRSQRVRVDGVLSESLEITSGVPQGSVLLLLLLAHAGRVGLFCLQVKELSNLYRPKPQWDVGEIFQRGQSLGEGYK